jgi:hypothetical protein
MHPTAPYKTITRVRTTARGLTLRPETNDGGPNDPNGITKVMQVYGRLFPIGGKLPFRFAVPISRTHPTGQAVTYVVMTRSMLEDLIASAQRDSAGGSVTVLIDHIPGPVGVIDTFTFVDGWLCVSISIYGPALLGLKRHAHLRELLRTGAIKHMSIGILGEQIGTPNARYVLYEGSLVHNPHHRGAEIMVAQCSLNAPHVSTISEAQPMDVSYDDNLTMSDPTATAPAETPAVDAPATATAPETAAAAAEPAPAPAAEPAEVTIDPAIAALIKDANEQVESAKKEMADMEPAEAEAEADAEAEAEIGAKRTRDAAELDSVRTELAASKETIVAYERRAAVGEKTQEAMSDALRLLTEQVGVLKKTISVNHAKRSKTQPPAPAPVAMVTGSRPAAAAPIAARALGRAGANPGPHIGEPEEPTAKRFKMTDVQAEFSNTLLRSFTADHRELVESNREGKTAGEKRFLEFHDNMVTARGRR